ncbi:MAG: rhodanese-like domain-containing protein [Hungatella sp.]|nr:rhodanese-like domain-containing protein [Hungatella sp.]MCI9503339.1 rhodanese-like domain-containing protein [Hungatella sp.]MCI9635046.1 rhodanese-like domain-containing protein [Hungatella sp.]
MNYPTISMRELECWICYGRPMELIDLRNRRAFGYSHLMNAVNFPFEELEAMIQEGIPLPFSKGLPLVFYCSRGGQSMLVCNHLSVRGYPVVNTAGGLAAYRGGYLVYC